MLRLMLMSVFLGSLGQIMVKVGADRLGGLALSPATFLNDLGRLARVPEFWFAMVLMGFSSLFWVKVLTRSELSSAYPLGSLGYVFVLLLSAILLNEALTFTKALGVAVIMAGILILYK